jgi:hypothetical protein
LLRPQVAPVTPRASDSFGRVVVLERFRLDFFGFLLYIALSDYGRGGFMGAQEDIEATKERVEAALQKAGIDTARAEWGRIEDIRGIYTGNFLSSTSWVFFWGGLQHNQTATLGTEVVLWRVDDRDSKNRLPVILMGTSVLGKQDREWILNYRQSARFGYRDRMDFIPHPVGMQFRDDGVVILSVNSQERFEGVIRIMAEFYLQGVLTPFGD